MLPNNQPPQPGQFHNPPSPPPYKLNLWQWYKQQKRGTQLWIGCVTVLVLLVFLYALWGFEGATTTQPSPKVLQVSTQIASTEAAMNAAQSATVTPTQPSVLAPIPTQAPSPTPTPTPKPSPTPTPKPTTAPTPKPTQPPAPTQPPQPTGVYGNPWGYDFNPGNLIYNPPANFCTYFHCIKSFWEPDDPGDGYVVECADSLFSQSGGERGACSYHGGVLRPLYSH